VIHPPELSGSNQKRQFVAKQEKHREKFLGIFAYKKKQESLLLPQSTPSELSFSTGIEDMLTEREIPHNARPELQTLYRYVKTIILQGYLKDGNVFASIRDSLQPSLYGKEVILLKARFLILVQGLYKSDMRDNGHDVLSQNFVPSSHKQTQTHTPISLCQCLTRRKTRWQSVEHFQIRTQGNVANKKIQYSTNPMDTMSSIDCTTMSPRWPEWITDLVSLRGKKGL
jgi:hypothetical protein